jgi:hypothetical protein
MQNKPNFVEAQMNVNIYYTKVYKNETASGSGKNKPKTNPIQTQSKPVLSAVEWANFRKAQNERKLTFSKGL